MKTRPSSARPLYSLWLPAGLAFAVLLGCRKSDEITRYQVERLEQPKSTTAGMRGKSAGTPQRVLGGIFIRGDQAWFFKAFGEPAAIAAQEKAFEQLLGSVSFGADEKPQWQLPPEWKQLPGSQFRLATLKMGAAESAPEVSVIGLPKNTADDEYLVANLNRWREQLQLPPTSDVAKELETRRAGDLEYKYVTLEGTSSGGGGMAAPFANRPRPSVADTPPERPAADPNSSAKDLQFTLPAGWKEIPPPSNMTKAAFQATDDAGKLDVTITELNGEGGGLLPNLNRWRGQLKLSPLSEDDLAKTIREVPVGAVQAKLISMTAGDGDSAESILGAVIFDGKRSYFIKARGPASLAERERERFESFVKSLRLP